MSELLEFITRYWTSLAPLAVLSGIYLTIGLLAIGFQLKKTESQLRARLLTWIFRLDLLGWSFIAISLAFCGLMLGAYEHNYVEGVRNVAGQAFSASLFTAFIISLVAKKRFTSSLLGQLKGREEATGELATNFQALATQMSVPKTHLYLADLPAPISMATSGRSNSVILARSLMKILTAEELSAVLSHELAHIRNGDALLKTLAVVYRRFLPQDPILRFLEPAIHREREFFADDLSSRLTGHPLRLASALIKIHEAYPANLHLASIGLSIMGSRPGFLSRHPPLKARVERLLRISLTLGIE